jgi:hypothetical protein
MTTEITILSIAVGMCGGANVLCFLTIRTLEKRLRVLEEDIYFIKRTATRGNNG